MNLKLTGPKYDCLVPWYRVGSPLSIDTKIMQIGQRITSQWRFQSWPDSNSGVSVKIDQNWKKKSIFSLKKFQISEFHPVFCLQRREMVFLTCPESFSTIPCRHFSKWRLKIFWGGNHPPLPSNFDDSPYPHLRGYPRFFSSKWPQRM